MSRCQSDPLVILSLCQSDASCHFVACHSNTQPIFYSTCLSSYKATLSDFKKKTNPCVIEDKLNWFDFFFVKSYWIIFLLFSITTSQVARKRLLLRKQNYRLKLKSLKINYIVLEGSTKTEPYFCTIIIFPWVWNL